MMGGRGVISVTANIAPRLMHDMCVAALQNDRITAQALNDRLVPLHRDLFIESNPIPVKWALHEMGLIPPGTRLPLTVLSAQYHDTIRQALREAGVVL